LNGEGIVSTDCISEWRAENPAAERGRGYHAVRVDIDLITPPIPRPIIQMARRWRGSRRERPFRFLLDSRLFRVLCDPAQTAVLGRFRASLGHQGLLSAEGLLPDLEMSPVAILDVLGVKPPQFPTIPLPKSMVTLKAVEVGILLMEQIKKEFGTVPELEASSLRRRVEELRQTVSPESHELFDLCLTDFVSREKFEEQILLQLTFDALFTFRFSVDFRERMTFLFNSFLLNNETKVSGLTRMRFLRVLWDQSLERILKRNPTARGEILAVDQEMKPRTYTDFLGWEAIHYAVVGYARKRVHPVVAFLPEPADRLRARCKAHKTAMRSFLDEIDPAVLRKELRPVLKVWTPGWLVSCGPDGALEAPLATEDVPLWAGAYPWTLLAPAGEGTV